MKIGDALKLGLAIESAREEIEEAEVGDCLPLPPVPLRVFGKRIRAELRLVIEAEPAKVTH